MRIVFMGSPDFSVPTLEALLGSSHELLGVYSQPPRPAGRGKSLRPTPVHQRAEAAGLEVFTPLNFKDKSEIERFKNLQADLAVVIAYGLLLPEPILQAPRLGAVNLHASLLPRWRGAAPIHRAIMAGDKETGICLMQMEKSLDTGPVFARNPTPINPEMTTGDLHDILAKLSAETLMQHIDNIENMTPKPQSDQGITYAQKISKDETPIDWTRPARDLQHFIHGLSPFPGAWSAFEGERIKFHRVALADGQAAAGTVLDEHLTIACGEGALKPLVIQRDGKKAMGIDEALRGMKNPKGKSMEGPQ